MYLDGKNVTPKTAKDAKLLIGKRVEYLRNCDIDRTGRGIAFPRQGMIENVVGRNLVIDGDYLFIKNISEMIIIE